VRQISADSKGTPELKPRRAHRGRRAWWEWPIRGFFASFNWGFERLAGGYHWLIARAVRFVVIMLVVYVGILAYGLNEFRKTPVGVYSAGRPRLSDRRAPAAAGGVAVPDR
jgi:multidrug efflux pump subunit AcrB